ncbi:MAG TPA: hypothetical protein PK760_10895, partial [Flavobacteriales bacterium]|nr:hypothetical protein [Flavobacteriales bacterium]
MNRAIALLLTALGCGNVFSTPLSVTVGVQNETCAYMNGSCYANAGGGVPPYTYLWSTNETTYGINGLGAGTYSVTVTDFEGTQVTAEGTVLSANYPPIYDYVHGYNAGDSYHAMFMPMGPVGTMLDVSPWNTSVGQPQQVPGALPGNYYLPLPGVSPGNGFTVNYWDVNGCQGQLIGVTGYPFEMPTLGVLSVEGSCSNMSTGTITVSCGQEGHAQELVLFLRSAGSGIFADGVGPVGVTAGTGTFDQLAPGDYWISMRLGVTMGLVQGDPSLSPDSIFVTVPNAGIGCGTLSGTAYMDYNSDCIDTEVNVPGAVVEILPGPYYATTNSLGGYSAVLPYGSYTASSSAAAIVQSCPASGNIDGLDNTAVADIGHQPTVPLDVAVGVSSGPARPGFVVGYHVSLFNQSSSASGNTTTTFTFDPTLTYVS